MLIWRSLASSTMFCACRCRRYSSRGRVETEDGAVIPGLLVCGEMLGGLFSGNYPGGSGLAAGSVFGRRAGSIA